MERPNGLSQVTAGAGQRARIVIEPDLCGKAANRERLCTQGSRQRLSALTKRGLLGTVAHRTDRIGGPRCCSHAALGRRYASATVFWGARRLRRGRVGRSTRPGAARGPQCRSRLPSGSHLQFRPLGRLSWVPVDLYLPGVPLRSCSLCRRRRATRLPTHALHLGRLRPIAHGTFRPS